jgi:ribosomal protein S18 acetylase RimI-like enzyme
MPPAISFRPIEAGDFEFLYLVYASTRSDIEQVQWPEELKQQFLRMQFLAQHTHYQQHYEKAQFQIVLQDNRPVGRLYVDHRPDELRIIDIALLPEHRRQGIGRSIMADLLAEATRQGKPVRIHVERFNPALALYERLGFQKIGDTGVYFLMESQVVQPANQELPDVGCASDHKMVS